MKTIKLLLATLLIGFSFSSCTVAVNDFDEPYYDYVSIEDVVTDYDLWYIDYNRTQGDGDVPFISRAFTLSFINGKVYANNNLVDIGINGNGYGIQIGYFDAYGNVLKINHNFEGYYNFDVIQVSGDQLKLRDNYNGVTYFLEGYQKDDFNYDQIFYDNIEYLLQEFDTWEKTYTSEVGTINEFDKKNFLAFTRENLTTFYSSRDEVGTPFANIYYDYEGDYSVANVAGYDNLKILTLHYDSSDNEEFELSVINDEKISLYHINSGTTYEFNGRGYIQYLKSSSSKKSTNSSVSNEGRKRTKVYRETKIRRNLK